MKFLDWDEKRENEKITLLLEHRFGHNNLYFIRCIMNLEFIIRIYSCWQQIYSDVDSQSNDE